MKTLKKVLAVVLALAMVLGMAVSASATYTDDKAINYDEAVAVMSLAGVLNGYTDGSFKPQGTLTRAEAAKVIVYMLGLEDTSLGYKANFGDINGHWAETPISVAAGLGIVAGVGNGKFDPNGTLTGFQWAKILLCAMGYDAEVEGMLGAGWEARTAKLIKATEMADDIAKFNGSKAVTREEACQMAFAVLTEGFVGYPDSAITAVKLGTEIETTKKSKFGTEDNFAKRLDLTEVKTENADKFGRPGTTWYVNKGKKTQKSVFLADEPVVTYSEKVNACDMLVDLGYPTSNDDDVKLNGKVVAHDDAKTCGAEKTEFGGQGVLTEVYKTKSATKTDPAEYLVIEINTYLAYVTNVVAEKTSKTGHVTDGYTVATVYKKDANTSIKLTGVEDYEKKDYILVQFPGNKVVDTKYANVIGEAESFDGACTKITSKGVCTVADVEYVPAKEFNFGKAAVEKTKYTWFLDQYGNLIGKTVIDNTGYAVITDVEWDPSEKAAFADVIYFGGETATVKIDTYKGSEMSVVERTGDLRVGQVSYLNDKKNNFYDGAELFKTLTDDKGAVQFTTSTSIKVSTGSILKATDTKFDGHVVDDATEFIVRTNVGTVSKPVYEYTTFTGMEELPNMVNSSVDAYYVLDTTNDTRIAKIYIKSYVSADEVGTYAFSLTGKYNTVYNATAGKNEIVMDLYLDGKLVEDVKITSEAIAKKIAKGKLYTATFAGNVLTKAELVDEAHDYNNDQVYVEYLSGDVIYKNGVLYGQGGASEAFDVVSEDVVINATSYDNLTEAVYGKVNDEAGVWVTFSVNSKGVKTIDNIYLGAKLVEEDLFTVTAFVGETTPAALTVVKTTAASVEGIYTVTLPAGSTSGVAFYVTATDKNTTVTFDTNSTTKYAFGRYNGDFNAEFKASTEAAVNVKLTPEYAVSTTQAIKLVVNYSQLRTLTFAKNTGAVNGFVTADAIDETEVRATITGGAVKLSVTATPDKASGSALTEDESKITAHLDIYKWDDGKYVAYDPSAAVADVTGTAVEGTVFNAVFTNVELVAGNTYKFVVTYTCTTGEVVIESDNHFVNSLSGN